ncbi:hypothetical protein FVEN_g9125 [Fusarium venenatum]|uniref:Uncharacterized protein n=1 Tax=Fusarium venenatum TaxID=56646 RepID=A0A2L2THD2_9HYPO|nr:uncharacterized protein FVRRES_00329 [Fusarium venenatum]KAG8352762.1 hypothetical protein FVEN_g9125 [Fusarium venenatum]KAH7006418.1 hypothetical protein EDB82DRAFT_116393 [Fusarium venenatum]CEI63817.1 unnamed protein product [Fusarium venenatum]
MVKKFNITVQNQSGAAQQYALVAEKPEVRGGNVSSPIWSSVFATAQAGEGDTAFFTIENQYFAILGTSQCRPQDGTNVSVSGTQPVELGSTRSDGTKEPGTTIGVVASNDMLQFSYDHSNPSGQSRAFELKTKTDFTHDDAQSKNFLIGAGASLNGRPVPLAAFVPGPNQQYQIEPKNVFYLVTGQYREGALVEEESMGYNRLRVDFGNARGNNISVTQTPDGRLIIQN